MCKREVYVGIALRYATVHHHAAKAIYFGTCIACTLDLLWYLCIASNLITPATYPAMHWVCSHRLDGEGRNGHYSQASLSAHTSIRNLHILYHPVSVTMAHLRQHAAAPCTGMPIRFHPLVQCSHPEDFVGHLLTSLKAVDHNLLSTPTR